MSDFTPIWPERLMLRDTGLHDDMGGGGQRIYTTAGRGYEKREYVRTDVVATPAPLGDIAELIERLRATSYLHHRGPDYEPLPVPPSALALEAATALTSLQAKLVEAQQKEKK